MFWSATLVLLGWPSIFCLLGFWTGDVILLGETWPGDRLPICWAGIATTGPPPWGSICWGG